ncbi:hypothetical protein Tco_0909738, partial [Tanacetum coccineum]
HLHDYRFMCRALFQPVSSPINRWQGPQVRNEDLRIQLYYYNEEYDEEMEMEPRPTCVRETTLVLRTGSPRVQRQNERVVEFEEAPNKEGIGTKRESDGRRPSEWIIEEGGSRGGNLSLLLAAHLGRSENGQPLQSTLTSGYRGN